MIGTHTNGTGAGFIGSGSFEDIQWHDRYELMSLRTPNRLFGYASNVGLNIVPDVNSYKTLNSENHPPAADVQYEATARDFSESGKDWVDTAISTINGL